MGGAHPFFRLNNPLKVMRLSSYRPYKLWKEVVANH
jgi:hypothetical protein